MARLVALCKLANVCFLLLSESVRLRRARGGILTTDHTDSEGSDCQRAATFFDVLEKTRQAERQACVLPICEIEAAIG